MLIAMTLNLIFTICTIAVAIDAKRHRGYTPGSGSLHSQGMLLFGFLAMLSWVAATLLFWLA